MKVAPESCLKGVLSYTDEKLVSQDSVHNVKSSIYDAPDCLSGHERVRLFERPRQFSCLSSF